MRNLVGCVEFLHTEPGEFVHVGVLNKDMTILSTPIDKYTRRRAAVCQVGDVKCAFDKDDKTHQKLCSSCNCDEGIWVTKHTWALARLTGAKTQSQGDSHE